MTEREIKKSFKKVKKHRDSKTAMRRQVVAIIRLLSIWPECPEEIITKYVFQRFGVSTTRAAYQIAKEKMGHAEHDWSEKMVRKNSVCRYIVTQLGFTHGLLNDDSSYYDEVRKEMKRVFSQNTQELYIKLWTKETLRELRANCPTPDLLKDRLEEGDEELKELGINFKGETDLL